MSQFKLLPYGLFHPPPPIPYKLINRYFIKISIAIYMYLGILHDFFGDMSHIRSYFFSPKNAEGWEGHSRVFYGLSYIVHVYCIQHIYV